MYHRAYHVPASVLRLCNVFGPDDYNTNYRVVPRAMKSIFGGAAPQSPSLYAGSVRHERDYVYVDDCIRAILTLAADANCRGKVYNLMGCAHLRTPEIIQAAIDAAVQVEQRFDAGKAAAIGQNGFKVVEESAKSVITISNQHMTGERLQRDTGFAPEVSLQEGLARTAMFYREHFRAGDGSPAGGDSIKSVQNNV
jgi:nucleoside-diphosphate-sugar epimerase